MYSRTIAQVSPGTGALRTFKQLTCRMRKFIYLGNTHTVQCTVPKAGFTQVKFFNGYPSNYISKRDPVTLWFLKLCCY